MATMLSTLRRGSAPVAAVPLGQAELPPAASIDPLHLQLAYLEHHDLERRFYLLLGLPGQAPSLGSSGVIGSGPEGPIYQGVRVWVREAVASGASWAELLRADPTLRQYRSLAGRAVSPRSGAVSVSGTLPPAFDPAGATGRRNLQRIYELGRELTGASPARRLEGNGIPDLLLPPASEVIDLIVAKPTVNGGRRGAKRLDRPATSAESSGSSAATAVRTSGAAVHEAITARVIDMLEHGIVPWRKGWEAGLPRNMEGRKYRGINAFMLAFAGRRNEAGEYIPFDSPYWITMYQANKRGGHVKAGEHATPVIWYDQRQVEDKDPDTGEERKRHYWLLRAYACFNLDQVEGVAPPEDAKPMVPVTPLEAFEALVAKMPGPPKISYDAGGPAFWRPTDDTIHLPPLKRWESAIELAVTKGHELTHSTGHEKRLGRPEVVNGGYDYTHHRDSRGREELTAEMGGALLAAEAGVVLEDLTERSASYVTGWIQTIRGDASALVAAGSAAQKAVDYIIGIDLKKTTETS